MEILVNDTNIFIDLHSVGLLRELCALPYDVRTVDFVINEIKDPAQAEYLSALVAEGKINVETFNISKCSKLNDSKTTLRAMNLLYPLRLLFCRFRIVVQSHMFICSLTTHRNRLKNKLAECII